jgi:hypothetical protein
MNEQTETARVEPACYAALFNVPMDYRNYRAAQQRSLDDAMRRMRNLCGWRYLLGCDGSVELLGA